ncbi:MAG: ABC transporter ATP-binding protein [Firmicutes bacterium]|nr:ABC transporter ATP-binding protein [Bacillota bacterium]
MEETKNKAAPVIRLQDVRKEYVVGDSHIHALDGVSLTVSPGEFVCISGRSGSGKSTMLNMLAGLEKPTSGEIVILDKHIENMSESARIRFRRQYIGFVFQSYNLMPQYTAVENVELPLMLRGIGKRERRKQALAVMEQVGIVSHAEHKPSELSGGQQQRVGIARALITKPPIVFADELTGNLDTKTSAEIMDLLTGLFRSSGTTFLLVSHDPDMSRYTDRTIHLLDGKIISEETNQSVRR